MRVSRWILLLALLPAAGCGSHGLRDPSFSPEALRARGLAIGGMVSAAGEPETRGQARAPLDSLLWATLDREIGRGILAPLDRADALLGPAGRRAALDALEDDGEVAWGVEVPRDLPDPGRVPYLIFGRIDQDETVCETATLPASEGSEALVVNITTRRIGASFSVYDLPAGRRVWSGRIVKTKSVGQQMDDSAEDNLAGAVLSVLFPGDQKPEFLPPAPFEVVARKVFGELASQIAP